jgi:hypothetical protein
MKKIVFFFVLLLGSLFAFTQELITNGNFTSPTISPWAATANSAGVNGWFGPGASGCGQTTNNNYVWFADLEEQTGVDNLVEGLYQQISIPANASSATLSFRVSISTLESGSTPYDFFRVNVLGTAGNLLETLWSLDNSYGNYGIPGCGTWFILTSAIPSTYFGQTIRLAFEATTDGTLPTIFRFDDVSVLVSTQVPSCTYSLSSNTYICANANANNYNNVVLVNTQNGCSWNASVLSGGSWLTTSSSGNGSGGVNIIVSENTNPSPRSGIISVGDQSFTVTQPGADCTYSLNVDNYVCPDPSAATLNSIALVNTQGNCTWSAVVTSGNSWMACSSSGSGSGAINILVQENTTNTARTGTLAIQGQTLTIIQPAGAGNSIEESVIELMKVYPNPTRGITQITQISDVNSIKFYDITGREIQPSLSFSDEVLNVDLSNQAAGIIFVKDQKTNAVRKITLEK